MQAIPGIHIATGDFHQALPADARPVAPNRHAAGARLGDWLSAAVDSRDGPAHAGAADASGVTVLFEGHLAGVAGHPAPHTAPAAAVLACYLESGLGCLAGLRGSYTGLILDPRSNQAHLFNDRRASRPLFWREGADRALLIGPEVFHLAAAGPAVQAIDPVAVCEFVIFASYYNDRTLFPGIRKLPPGTVMSLAPGSVALRRYWTVRIDGDKPPIDEDACVEEALALFDQSLRRLPAGRSRPFLFLSGGIDSRVILGSLRSAGLTFPAVSYGTTEGDDAPIAGRLAAHCKLPFTFHPIPADDVQRHFADTARRSDCRAETVDTPTYGPLLEQLGDVFDLSVQGDKSFFGKDAATATQALAATGMFSFAEAPRLADMLEPAILRRAQAEIGATLDEILAAGRAIDPQDLKDKIYYEQRLANRQNAFAAMNLREFEQARPWLDEDLVDFLFAAPGGLRRDKRINRKMLDKAHPDLAALPYASRDSIPQAAAYRRDIAANRALADFVRSQFHEALDDRLAALFRPRELAALADSLTNGAPYPQPGAEWWHRLPGMWKISANRYRADRLHPVKIMLRLMQVNLYLEALSTAPRPSPAAHASPCHA